LYGQVCETIVGGGGCAFAHGAEVGARRPHRCGQPGQQHGRRIPSFSSEHTLSTCWRLVSSFFTEMVQQIHSLRASGVRSSQAVNAFASDARAFRRSAGRSCTTPWEIRLVVIGLSRGLTIKNRVHQDSADAGPMGNVCFFITRYADVASLVITRWTVIRPHAMRRCAAAGRSKRKVRACEVPFLVMRGVWN